MKFWLKILLCFIFMFFLSSDVEAVNFYTGSYINGEYITRVKDGKYYYLTLRFIEDATGNVLYCLEPFVSFDSTADYTEVNPYPYLSQEILRKVELISYYGYGYKNRTSNKWYVVTQFLIWKTVTTNDIYFTDKLNGNKLVKYENEMAEILLDVSRHDVSYLIRNYKVNYDEDLFLNIDGYNIVSSDYEISNNKINNVRNNGKVVVSKVSNFYSVNGAYYDGGYSQNLILRGNVDNFMEEININVLKSNILLDIKVDDNLLNFNVCYDILSDDVVVDHVCTNDDLEYKSVDLKYGKYKVIQSSISEGYKKDENVYEIDLGMDTKKITLNNVLIRNKVEIFKYYCETDNCIEEENAVFEVYDKDENKIGTITTDEVGYGSLDLIYGDYLVRQIQGKDGYSFINDFVVKVDSLLEEYKYNLRNMKKLEEIPNNNEEVIDETNEFIDEGNKVEQKNPVIDEREELQDGEIIPPNTGLDVYWFSVLGGIVILNRLRGIV